VQIPSSQLACCCNSHVRHMCRQRYLCRTTSQKHRLSSTEHPYIRTCLVAHVPNMPQPASCNQAEAATLPHLTHRLHPQPAAAAAAGAKRSCQGSRCRCCCLLLLFLAMQGAPCHARWLHLAAPWGCLRARHEVTTVDVEAVHFTETSNWWAATQRRLIAAAVQSTKLVLQQGPLLWQYSHAAVHCSHQAFQHILPAHAV
jgi:hypothetical protein